jgi:hypothetical protein
MSIVTRLRAQLAGHGQFSAVHPFALASVATGLFAALTGAELGPFAPLVVSLGVYTMLFGLVLEVAVILRVAARSLCRRGRDTSAGTAP